MSVALRLERLPLSRYHLLVTAAVGGAYGFRGLASGIVTFVIPSLRTEWGLTNDEAGLILSASIAGMMVGGPLLGRLADRFGRRALLQLCVLLYALGTGLGAVAPGAAVLIVLRFVAGIGIGGSGPVASSLVGEFAPTRYRGRFFLFLETFWVEGSILAAVLAYFIIPAPEGWRLSFAISAVPALYVIVIHFLIPESPRFLMARGRHQEAERLLRAIEKRCGQPPAAERLAAPSAPASPGAPPTVGFRALWARGYVRRTVVVWTLWFVSNFVFYGLFTWLPTLLVDAGYTLSSSFEFVLILTVAQLPGCITAGYLVDRLGRKRTIVPFLVLCGVSAFLFGQADSVAGILIWGSLMSFLVLGAWGMMNAYTSELYPTRVRATGLGWAAAFGRIGGISAPLIVGLVLGTFGGGLTVVYAIFAGAAILGGLAVATLGEETAAKSLEQIGA